MYYCFKRALFDRQWSEDTEHWLSGGSLYFYIANWLRKVIKGK